MIRCIDLTIRSTTDFKFAMYDTIKDKFVEFNGNQSWSSVTDFISDCTDTDTKKYIDATKAADMRGHHYSKNEYPSSDEELIRIESVKKAVQSIDLLKNIPENLIKSTIFALYEVAFYVTYDKYSLRDYYNSSAIYLCRKYNKEFFNDPRFNASTSKCT